MRVASTIALLGLVIATEAHSQPSCRVEYTTWNANRYVYGPVDTECSGVHSKPFGNWGVRTESHGKIDGHQFQGWCNNHLVQDPENNNRLKLECTDGWYEWNSCTFHGWSPPNRHFYNYNDHTQQMSTTGISNDHGSGVMWFDAACPSDTNGDGTFDTGGCKDAISGDFTVSGHRMELFELDPLSRDTHVETLRFPDLQIAARDLVCDPDGCVRGVYGDWESPRTRSSPVTSAQVTVQIRAAFFVDPYGQCSSQDD